MKVVLATALMAVTSAALAQDPLYDTAVPPRADDAWWEGEETEEEDEVRWEDPDEFGWGENEYGDRYGVREWGQSESDWSYLDSYNYYMDYEETDDGPGLETEEIADGEAGYEGESVETDYWYEDDVIDNLRGYRPDDVVPLVPPEEEEGPAAPIEDRFHYDDPYVYDPNYDLDVGDSDLDRFESWYLDEERQGPQRFYDSLRL